MGHSQNIRSVAQTTKPKFAFASLLALVLAAGSLGCGPSAPTVKLATVSPQPMPDGGTFHGVWYSQVWGYLHIAVDKASGRAVGKYKSTSQSVWGRLEGQTNGNLFKFSWVDHKEGMIGPNATRKGKGFFTFKMGAEKTDDPVIEGEFGLDENEVGAGDWKFVRQRNQNPDLNSIGASEDPTIDTGWDKPKK